MAVKVFTRFLFGHCRVLLVKGGWNLLSHVDERQPREQAVPGPSVELLPLPRRLGHGKKVVVGFRVLGFRGSGSSSGSSSSISSSTKAKIKVD